MKRRMREKVRMRYLETLSSLNRYFLSSHKIRELNMATVMIEKLRDDTAASESLSATWVAR